MRAILYMIAIAIIESTALVIRNDRLVQKKVFRQAPVTPSINDCVCVEYNLCNANYTLNKYGVVVIDIRRTELSTCEHYLDVCCRNEDMLVPVTLTPSTIDPSLHNTQSNLSTSSPPPNAISNSGSSDVPPNKNTPLPSSLSTNNPVSSYASLPTPPSTNTSPSNPSPGNSVVTNNSVSSNLPISNTFVPISLTANGIQAASNLPDTNQSPSQPSNCSPLPNSPTTNTPLSTSTTNSSVLPDCATTNNSTLNLPTTNTLSSSSSSTIDPSLSSPTTKTPLAIPTTASSLSPNSATTIISSPVLPSSNIPLLNASSTNSPLSNASSTNIPFPDSPLTENPTSRPFTTDDLLSDNEVSLTEYRDTLMNPPRTVTKGRYQSRGCGFRNIDGVAFRIIGGKTEAQFGEFPWVVALLRENEFICGGSLIHPNVVLTSAHCVRGILVEKLVARAGEWDRGTTKETLPYQDRKIAEIVEHEHFHSVALFNDVALLILKEPMKLTDNVDVICLPKQDMEFDDSECIASGWGKDNFNSKNYQVILKKVFLPVIARHTCLAMLRKTRLGPRFELHESFICAGGKKNQDTCKGDGGGPLMCPLRDDPFRYQQAGIVAWGIGCGDVNPGVYVKVAHFRDWIDSQLQKRSITL